MIEQKINDVFGDADRLVLGPAGGAAYRQFFLGFSHSERYCASFPSITNRSSISFALSYSRHRILIQCLIVAQPSSGCFPQFFAEKGFGAHGTPAHHLQPLGRLYVQINETLHDGPANGLDWFLLDLLLTAIIYVPLERLWPLHPQQGTFRDQWTLDVVYFMSTHLPIQILSFLILLPAVQFGKYLSVPGLQSLIARLPWFLQFFLAVLVADVAEYFIHLRFTKSHFYGAFMPFTFFHGARLALGIARSLLGRHNRAHMYPYPSHDRLFPIHHFGVSDFCDTSSYLVTLQFLAQPEMAREVSGDAQIPSLAPYFSKRRPRQKFRRPFSLDRQESSEPITTPMNGPEVMAWRGEQISAGSVRQTMEPFTRRKRR